MWWLLAVRHHKTSTPIWSAPSRWRMQQLDMKATGGDQP
jgi:hypothetical protein